MVNLKSGNVNIGDALLYVTGGKKYLGKFESLYNNKINIRLNHDNSLHTVSFDEVDKASDELLKTYYNNKDKNELVTQVKALAELLKAHKVEVVIKDA